MTDKKKRAVEGVEKLLLDLIKGGNSSLPPASAEERIEAARKILP